MPFIRYQEEDLSAIAALPAKRAREPPAAVAPPPAAADSGARASGGAGAKKTKRDEEKVSDPESDELGDFTSTRELVIRWEEERAEAEMAGKVKPLVKEKTGYQLYHMHRVAEIKSKRDQGQATRKGDGGVKHHEAFKKAARDWSRPEARATVKSCACCSRLRASTTR